MKRSLLLCLVGLNLYVNSPAAVIDARVSGFNETERRVLGSAIDFWQRSIADPFTVEVSFTMLDLAGDVLGTSSDLVESPDGLPAEATVQIDNRAGAIFGWYVDATPQSNEEFLPGSSPSHLRGDPSKPSGQYYDLLTVFHHELAHVFGFSIDYDRFRSHISLGDDGFLRSYVGDSVAAVIAPEYDGTHLSDAIYPFDLMTAFQSRGQRLLPSDLDFGILSDAFGYTLNVNSSEPVPEPGFFLAVAVCLTAILLQVRRRPASDMAPTRVLPVRGCSNGDAS
jgi:hypothetical protein